MLRGDMPWKNMMLPDVDASVTPNATTVGQLLPVHENVTLPLDDTAPADGAANVVSWRLYPLPTISVPEVVAVGATEYRLAYTLAGDV